MKPNAKNLALRDPALALLVGAIGASDFGIEEVGIEEESQFGGDFEFGDDYGFEFGDEWGADAPAINPVSLAASSVPSKQAIMTAWSNLQREKQQTERRAMLLEPNKRSRIKVERYTFAVNQTLALGTAEALDMDNSPDVNIRPQRVTANAPVPGFATLSDIKVANVSVGVGGTLDAYQFNANGVGQTLDMPTLSPANKARVTGNYTGLTPTGYTATAAFEMVISFTGPASIVA
jgi:hypothetical protein